MAKERLVDRIPPGALKAFDDQMRRGADHRRALRPISETGTRRYYEIKLANYERWCAAAGYQADIGFITDARVEEYVCYLVSAKVRAAPSTINQTICALGHYAERAAVEPMPSMRGARNVLKTYKAELEKRELLGGG